MTGQFWRVSEGEEHKEEVVEVGGCVCGWCGVDGGVGVDNALAPAGNQMGFNG